MANNTLGKDKAFLLYVKGVTERIGGILRKHDITPIFKRQNTIVSLFPTVKDKQDKLLVKGIYQIPCECGKAYIGETGRSVRIRVKEHERYIRLKQINMSAIAEHAIEMNHKIALEDRKVFFLGTKDSRGY